ncbi:MAG: serine/threonine-protein kinase [Candidatus Obscuribacter sp.]|nr:serine/threonine-protein kinase [Candidatus Obscuribacter sp.]
MTSGKDKFNLQKDDQGFIGKDSFVGKVLDHYEVEEKIAEGGLSTVYRATDTNNRQTVVLKIIHKHLISSIKNYKKLEQKIRALINLNDPHIATYKDVVFADGRVVLVMKPFIFESLEDLLSKTGHIGPERAVGIFIQVCQAMEAANKADIVHRDLKPSNIIILDNQKFSDDIMVLDFGIAKIIADETEGGKSEQFMTRTRETFGSPLYLSPEQCAGKKVDLRSDIYSLGCVIYESLTGKPPFVGKNVLETAYKHMNDNPRPMGLDVSMEPVSSRFEDVVSKCLAKDPDNRYQSAQELASDLDLIMTASDAEWENTAYVYQEVTPRKREGRGGKRISVEALIWTSAIVILVGIVGFWSWFILKPEGSKKYPSFDNDQLWLVAGQNKPTPVDDFGNKEESNKLTLQNIERDMGTNCREYADALLVLVQLYYDCQHWNDAEQYSKKLVSVTEKLEKDGQEGPGPLSECFRMVAYAAFRAGDYSEAVNAANRSVELAYGKETLNGSTIQCLRILGDVFSRQNKLRKAAEVYNRLFAIADQDKEQHPTIYWEATAKFADVYRRLGDFGEAERFYKLGLEWWRSHGMPDNIWAARALYGYALVLNSENKHKEAEEALKEDLALIKRLPNPDLGLVGAVRKQYVETMWHSNWMGAVSAQFGKLEPDGQTKPK